MVDILLPLWYRKAQQRSNEKKKVPPRMRILVCGSRDWPYKQPIFNDLNRLYLESPELITLIEGGAKGADEFAAEWAQILPEGHHLKFPADWTKHGKAAGPIRNQQMLDEGHPTLVLAYTNKPLDESRGTRDMVTRAKKAGIKTIVTYFYKETYDAR